MSETEAVAPPTGTDDAAVAAVVAAAEAEAESPTEDAAVPQEPPVAAAPTVAATVEEETTIAVAPTEPEASGGTATAATEQAPAADATSTATTAATASISISTEQPQASTDGAPLPESGVAAETVEDTAMKAEEVERPSDADATSTTPAPTPPSETGGQPPLPPTTPTNQPTTKSSSKSSSKPKPPRDYGPVITTYDEMDVLSGRGAAVNNHPGNKKFRALCFVRKAHFDLGNHAAKRKLATEIVEILQCGKDHPPSRFLKKRPANAMSAAEVEATGVEAADVNVAATPTTGTTEEGGQEPSAATIINTTATNTSTTTTTLYYAMTKEQAILKAQQVMRDYKRPDRLEAKILQQQAQQARYLPQQGGDGSAVSGDGASTVAAATSNTTTSSLPKPHRARATPSTPLEGVVEMLDAPDVEKDVLFQANPFGVHAHDVLSGRGAYVNGHVGNARLRTLAIERKTRFDTGNYTDKRQLASEIVTIVKSLDPPGRFLKKASQQVLDAHAEADKAGPVAEVQVETEEATKEQPDVAMKEEEAAANNNSAPASAEATTTATETNNDATASETPPETAKEEEKTTDPAAPAEAEAATDSETAPSAETPTTTTATPMQQSQQPPPQNTLPRLIDGIWEELSDDKAIHKACQVMRDISRPDRKYREQRKEERLKHKRNNKRRKMNDGGRVSLSTDGVENEIDETEDNTEGGEGEAATTEANANNSAPGETEPAPPPATGNDAQDVTAMETEQTLAQDPPSQTTEQTATAGAAAAASAVPTEIKGEPPAAIDSSEAKETSLSTAVEDVVDKALLDSAGTTTGSDPSATATLTEV
jgi:hypothetical protein